MWSYAIASHVIKKLGGPVVAVALTGASVVVAAVSGFIAGNITRNKA